MTRPSIVDLRVAVGQLSEIRQRIATAETFRGYRSATVAATALLGLLGAFIQAWSVPSPSQDPESYILLWVGIAVVCSVASFAQVAYRGWRAESPHEFARTRVALEQLLPSLILGAAFTWAICDWQPEAIWLLPAIWSGLFGLGILASMRQLPRPIAWIGLYYLASAFVPLAAGPGEWACSPWWMVQSFGVGQAAVAVTLYVCLERNDSTPKGLESLNSRESH